MSLFWEAGSNSPAISAPHHHMPEWKTLKTMTGEYQMMTNIQNPKGNLHFTLLFVGNIRVIVNQPVSTGCPLSAVRGPELANAALVSSNSFHLS